jgi:leucyl aminopeptidase
MIHAVGRASPRAPRLIDLVWGDPAHPKGDARRQGRRFDTGGLDLKPSASMLLMKKDMGGAAACDRAARMIMLAQAAGAPASAGAGGGECGLGLGLPPRRCAGQPQGAQRRDRQHRCRGPLILADALALADEETPELLIDYATLTGAARVAGAGSAKLRTFENMDPRLRGDDGLISFAAAPRLRANQF